MMRGFKIGVCLVYMLGGSSVAMGAADTESGQDPLTKKEMYKMNSGELLKRVDASAEEDFHAAEIAWGRGEVIEAQGMYERAAKKGHTGAMVKYGDIMSRAGFMNDAIASYRQAADLGDPAGQYNLSAMYLDLGNYDWKNADSKINQAEAMKWLKMAAEQDYPEAITLIASIYAGGGMGLTEADRTNEEVLKWLNKSAANGSGIAMDKLAESYRDGLFGLPVDVKIADEWQAKASKAHGVKEQAQKKARKKRL